MLSFCSIRQPKLEGGTILVQVLHKPSHSASLRSLETLLLLRIVRVAPYRESVVQTGEVDILPRHTRLGQSLVRVRLQRLGVCLVVLWGQELNRHLYSIHFGLFQQRGMRSGHSVHERGVSRQLEDGPAAIAEPDGTELGVL